jgi:hypothetical protein
MAQANERPGRVPRAWVATARAVPVAPAELTPPRSAPARGSRRTVITAGSNSIVTVPSRSVR